MIRSEDQQRWLDSLGPMSPNVRELVAAAVIDGDWMLYAKESFSITLRRYDTTTDWPCPYEEITIWRTNGRFTAGRRYRATPAGSTRRIDDLRAWITAEPAS